MAGKLYATMFMMPIWGGNQTAALYSYDGTAWTKLNVALPGGNMELGVDFGGNMHAANGPHNFFLTTTQDIATFNGTALSTTVMTESYTWTTGGFTFADGYYFIAGAQDGKIRTNDPIFGNVKAPPTLTADTSDNDTAHDIELTFMDDADWREAISGAEATKNGMDVSVQHSESEGKITLTGLNSPGSYEIKVQANGYADAVVQQQVNLLPSVWYDITDTLDLSAPVLSYDNGKIYAFKMFSTTIYYRSITDLHWQSVELTNNQFGIPFAFAARGGKWYIADLLQTDPMSPSTYRFHVSGNQGATWSTETMPSSFVLTGALNSITVDSAGAVYFQDNKKVIILSANGTWSQIPVFPNESDGSMYAISGVAVDGNRVLYANIRKYHPSQPNNHSAKLYKYDATSQQWVAIANSPSSTMQLYTDTEDGMHATATLAQFGETPSAVIYRVDEHGFSDAATLDSPDQVRYGLVYGGNHYYTLDKDFKTLRTTNPNYPYVPTYKVKYEGNGNTGGMVPTDSHAYEKDATAMVVGAGGLSRMGYTFAGWNTAADGKGTDYSADDTMTIGEANVTLYAQWTANDYEVTFDAAGGTMGTTTQTKQFGSAYGKGADGSTDEALPVPTREGHSFVGWYTAANGGGTLVTDATTVASAGNHTLYAKWTIATYTVTFDAAGGTVNPVTQTKQYNAAYGKGADGIGDETLPVPVREGYTFDGWFTGANGLGTQVTDTTTVTATANHTLFAKWTANVYSIIFDSNQGSPVDTIQADFGKTIDAPVPPTLAGYQFAGWYKDSGMTIAWNFATDTVPLNGTTLYARWADLYTVTYNGHGNRGGTVPTDSQGYEQGAAATVAGAGDLTKTGYTFAGWTTQENGGGAAYSDGDSLTFDGAGVVLYAQWTANDYEVTFDAAGGTFDSALETVTFTKQYDAAYGKGADGSENVDLPIPARSGYAFAGWYTGTGGTGTQVTNATTVATAGNHTLYATWVANDYVVTFDAAEGTVDPGSQTKQYDAPYGKSADGIADEALPVPVREGYTFAGWYTKVNDTDILVTDATPVTKAEQHMLVAKWTPTLYAITFDSNEGSAVDTVQASFGETFTAPGAPMRTGYRFDGWYKEESLTTAWKFNSDTVPVNGTTLYAKWTKVYTVTYNGNDQSGGNVPTDTNAYEAGEFATIKGNAEHLVRSGYTFAGWSIKQDGSGHTYREGDPLTLVDENITLYAVWIPVQSSTTNTNSGQIQTGDATVLVNGKPESAGKATTTETNGRKVTTVEVDEQKLAQRLEAEGNGSVMTIPVNTAADTVAGELNGRMVKGMEDKQATVEIRTEKAAYSLPAKEININAISAQFGTQLNLEDIKVRIEIAAPSNETVQVVENAAADNGLSIVIPPMNFTVTAVYGGTTVEVSKFNAYVERTVAIPEGVDPSRITTGIVVEADGTVRHVPTKIVQIDGVYYAKINSLTNSTYSVVWHPLEFADVAKHWAKDAVNNLGSRMVVQGAEDGSFQPERDMTRAEFAAVLVRALGLRLETGKAKFSDVQASDWYNDFVITAASANLISGFEDGTFRPNAKISREQAMKMLANAMIVTGLKAKLSPSSAESRLSGFVDGDSLSAWARSSAADVLEAGIVNGRSGGKLAAQAYITRAEVAVMVERLLKASELI